MLKGAFFHCASEYPGECEKECPIFSSHLGIIAGSPRGPLASSRSSYATVCHRDPCQGNECA